MQYRYQAYNKDKKIVKGSIEGLSEEAAEATLYRAGFQRVISLKAGGAGYDWKKFLVGTPKVSQQALLDFTTELAMMIEAGLSLQNSLGQLEKQVGEASLREVVAKLAADLRGGTPFHQALGAHPQVFSQTYISMIEANEKSGTLDDGLRQLAKSLKQEVETKARIQQALVQPAIVVCLAIAVIFIMVSFVLPKLAGVFQQFGASLPPSTRLLIDFSNFFADNKWYILLAVIIIFAVLFMLSRRPATRRYLDGLMIKMPLIGQIVIWENTARFARICSNLLKAGVLLPDAMNIVVRNMSNICMQDALTEVRRKLIQGNTFSEAVNTEPLFPQFLTEMIAVGESSGTLETALGTVADYYESRTTRRIDRLTGLIEPILIVVLALGVGFIAVTMITTIYGLLNEIH